MASNRNRNGCVRYRAMRVGMLVLFVAWPALTSHAQTYYYEVPEYTKSVTLSGDAAKIAADHLAKVIKLLRNGGPPPSLSEVEAAKWTFQDAARGYDIPGGYSKEQYLADYRREFLKKWQAQIEGYVQERPKGVFRVRSGTSFSSNNILTPGGSSGFVDAEALVNQLHDSGNAELGETTDKSAKPTHPTPASDAFMWIFQNLAKDGKGNIRKRQDE